MSLFKDYNLTDQVAAIGCGLVKSIESFENIEKIILF